MKGNKTKAQLLAQIQELQLQVARLEESGREQTRAQETLRLIDATYRNLIETSLDALISIGLDGKIMDANGAAELITGYSRRELIGSDLVNYLSEPSEIREAFSRPVQENALRNLHLEIRHKQGHTVPVLCNVSKFRDESGTSRGWLASARDIGELKAWAERLSENEIRFHAIADSSNNWEYWLEANGSLAYVSPACQVISGYSPEEFRNNPGLLQTIIYPEDRALFDQHHGEPFDTGLHLPLEFRILSKTGEVHWILHLCQPVFGANGQFLGRRATNQDITIRKNSEIERAHDEQRMKQLTQQLITAQEAERRRISQDLHDDIGQALTALLLRLNAICAGLAPDQAEARDELLEAIRSVEALMNQVRQLAHQLRPSALDSMPLSKAIGSLCPSFAQRSGLEVHYSCDPDLPPVPNIQATALYRLVQEGLTNAVKHARATSVWINLDYADGEICLSVEDNGEGFDVREVSDGMGLQGIRDRFRMLNGNLDIESAPSQGTHLYGSLPLANHSL